MVECNSKVLEVYRMRDVWSESYGMVGWEGGVGFKGLGRIW